MSGSPSGGLVFLDGDGARGVQYGVRDLPRPIRRDRIRLREAARLLRPHIVDRGTACHEGHEQRHAAESPEALDHSPSSVAASLPASADEGGARPALTGLSYLAMPVPTNERQAQRRLAPCTRSETRQSDSS